MPVLQPELRAPVVDKVVFRIKPTMDELLVLVGLVLLALGGEFLVRGTVGLSRKLGISPLLAGLTIVGFGTSAPELFTSLQAVFSGANDIAIGNVVGSNIANILLILGVSALIIGIPITRKVFRRDGIAMAVAAIATLGAVLSGGVSQLMGFVLIGGLVVRFSPAWSWLSVSLGCAFGVQQISQG